LLQWNVLRSIVQIVERDRLAGAGSVTAISGEIFSGKTTILSRLERVPMLKRKVRVLDLSSFFVFESLRESMSDSFKLSFSEGEWPNSVNIPKALERYILLSEMRIFAIDDAHQWLNMSRYEKADFLSLVARLVAPPLNLTLLLSGPPEALQAEHIAEVCNCELTTLTVGSWGYSQEYLRFLSLVERSEMASYGVESGTSCLVHGNVPALILQKSEGQTGSIISNVRRLVALSTQALDFNLTEETVMQVLANGWEL
jgi:hypothetical protein